MSRSLWKGPFTDSFPLMCVNKARPKIWSRRSQILPIHVGKLFLVYNGRNFVNVKCIQAMCLRKWGEFAVTRKRPTHKFNKKKQLHKNIKKPSNKVTK